jgi:hypothetical protein
MAATNPTRSVQKISDFKILPRRRCAGGACAKDWPAKFLAAVFERAIVNISLRGEALQSITELISASLQDVREYSMQNLSAWLSTSTGTNGGRLVFCFGAEI